jgi:phosphoglycolate phosphatase-like HAD superfamily hydrolase
MDAIVFDIDGTLLDSFEADCDLFVVAAKKVLRISTINTDWSAYRHVTDEGILREIMRENGIAPDAGLVAETKREFVAALEQHIECHGPFQEIPGAIEFVSRLLASKNHYVAYATGAWRESAMVKLTSAGFPTDGVKVSTSSDFEDRVSIMRGALSVGPAGIERITYYGDGIWDRTAALELGWDFVPVGETLGGLRNFHGTTLAED